MACSSGSEDFGMRRWRQRCFQPLSRMMSLVDRVSLTCVFKLNHPKIQAFIGVLHPHHLTIKPESDAFNTKRIPLFIPSMLNFRCGVMVDVIMDSSWASQTSLGGSSGSDPPRLRPSSTGHQSIQPNGF